MSSSINNYTSLDKYLGLSPNVRISSVFGIEDLLYHSLSFLEEKSFRYRRVSKTWNAALAHRPELERKVRKSYRNVEVAIAFSDRSKIYSTRVANIDKKIGKYIEKYMLGWTILVLALQVALPTLSYFESPKNDRNFKVSLRYAFHIGPLHYISFVPILVKGLSHCVTRIMLRNLHRSQSEVKLAEAQHRMAKLKLLREIF